MTLASAAREMILPYALVLLSGSIASAEIAVSGNDTKPTRTDGVAGVDPNPDNIVILDLKGPMPKVIGRVDSVPTSVVGPPSSVAITPDEGLALISASTKIDPNDILILRIDWLCRSEYASAQHIVIGRRAGLGDADIQRIIDGPAAAGWSPFEAALVRVADEFRRDAVVSDPTWQALAERYGPDELMDMVFTVGQYNLVSIALNSFGAQFDPGLEGFSRWRAR